MEPRFSKGQKQIARYIVEHYDKAAFMTAAKLGQAVGVSESTVVRFAAELGFEGYPQLQRSLQELIRNRLTNVQRMEITGEQIGDGDLLDKIQQAGVMIVGTEGTYSPNSYHDENGDLVGFDVDVARGVAEHLGVARGEIAAFGDAGNDVGMLEYAGRGYAMENASEEVLARVPLHAPANTEDGVARVLEDLLARGEIGG